MKTERTSRLRSRLASGNKKYVLLGRMRRDCRRAGETNNSAKTQEIMNRILFGDRFHAEVHRERLDKSGAPDDIFPEDIRAR